MTPLTAKFNKLLLIEIESLEDELKLMIDSIDDRLEKHEITSYVRNEQYSVITNEILGLRDVLHSGWAKAAEASSAAGTPIGDSETLLRVAALAKDTLKSRLDGHGYVPAVYDLISRRVDKIVAYLALDFDTKASS